MKNIKVLFCFEMITVIGVCTKGYMTWDWPLYGSIGLGVFAVALLYYFHFKYEKAKEKSDRNKDI
ncbi:hypothetical protein [Bacillus manliponensis]|uniref:hypothetical protein n=1 Tax=Bacillus manliponensis TaxID=574376 RepID=UPI00351307C2